MDKERILATAHVAALLSRDKGDFPWPAATFAYELSKIGEALNKRYVNTCSYDWANTPAYLARTEGLEAKARLLCESNHVPLEINTDPRGWALCLTIAEHETRL